MVLLADVQLNPAISHTRDQGKRNKTKKKNRNSGSSKTLMAIVKAGKVKWFGFRNSEEFVITEFELTRSNCIVLLWTYSSTLRLIFLTVVICIISLGWHCRTTQYRSTETLPTCFSNKDIAEEGRPWRRNKFTLIWEVHNAEMSKLCTSSFNAVIFTKSL